jgi:hypothetical protein
VYVLQHKGYRAGKVGITNEGAPRLRQHLSADWTVVATTHFEEGWRAVAVERAVLRLLRDEGSAPFLPAQAMRYGGHTETFNLHQRSVTSVAELITVESARIRTAEPQTSLYLYKRT